MEKHDIVYAEPKTKGQPWGIFFLLYLKCIKDLRPKSVSGVTCRAYWRWNGVLLLLEYASYWVAKSCLPMKQKETRNRLTVPIFLHLSSNSHWPQSKSLMTFEICSSEFLFWILQLFPIYQSRRVSGYDIASHHFHWPQSKSLMTFEICSNDIFYEFCNFFQFIREEECQVMT